MITRLNQSFGMPAFAHGYAHNVWGQIISGPLSLGRANTFSRLGQQNFSFSRCFTRQTFFAGCRSWTTNQGQGEEF